MTAVYERSVHNASHFFILARDWEKVFCTSMPKLETFQPLMTLPKLLKSKF